MSINKLVNNLERKKNANKLAGQSTQRKIHQKELKEVYNEIDENNQNKTSQINDNSYQINDNSYQINDELYCSIIDRENNPWSLTIIRVFEWILNFSSFVIVALGVYVSFHLSKSAEIAFFVGIIILIVTALFFGIFFVILENFKSNYVAKFEMIQLRKELKNLNDLLNHFKNKT